MQHLTKMNTVRKCACFVVFLCIYASFTEAQPQFRGGAGPGKGGAMYKQGGKVWAICDSDPQIGDWPTVFCKELGYPGAAEVKPIQQTVMDPSDADIFFKNPEQCSSTMSSCSSSGSCSNQEEVYIRCEENVRLAEGRSSQEGRAEVYKNGEWAVVCDEDLKRDNRWATVFCSQLGFSKHFKLEQAISSTNLPSREINCGANDTNMIDCVRGKSCVGNLNNVYISCGSQRKKGNIYMLFDVSASMKPIIKANYEQHFLTQQTEFLQKFFDFTSSDGHFAKYEINLVAVPFNDRLFVDEKWRLDYSTYSSALELRNAQDIGLDLFKDGINGKDPEGKTNIGGIMAMMKIRGSVIIILSDFVNMYHSPKPVNELEWFNTNRVFVVPVLLDSPHRNEGLYHKLKKANLGQIGFDVSHGITEEEFQQLFDTAFGQ